MSGSGGGGYVPPQRNAFDCETSVITTYVSSVDNTVLAKHRIGTILSLTIGRNNELLLEDGDGEILGALLHTNTSDIIECIIQGADYKAEIQKIASPSCIVYISSR